jgi:hypothetical protein
MVGLKINRVFNWRIWQKLKDVPIRGYVLDIFKRKIREAEHNEKTHIVLSVGYGFYHTGIFPNSGRQRNLVCDRLKGINRFPFKISFWNPGTGN